MPIATDNEDQEILINIDPPVQVNSISITDSSNESIAVDNRDTPRINLLTHIVGSSWVVDYYSQVLNTNSQLSGQQLSVSSVYQQYKKINNLEIKVTSALTSSQDEQKNMSVTGEATLFPFIIPNDGDMFIADIGNGKKAVFTITRTTKLSIYKQACYTISYVLDSESLIKIDDLNAKVVENTNYKASLALYGKDPIIASDTYASLVDLESSYNTLLHQYFNRFISKRFNTLILPNQLKAIYDPYLVDFILSVFNSWDILEVKDIVKFNVKDDEVMSCDSIWSAIKHRDISYLNTSFKQFGLVNTSTFSSQASNSVIRYSGIKKVIYPLDPLLTVDNTIVNNVKALSIETLVKTDPSILASMVDTVNLTSVTTPITINETPLVNKDTYYVLSSDFYNNTPVMSVLEKCVRRYIEGSNSDTTQLLQAAKQSVNWGLLEQFYYIPLLLVMIRTTIKG